MSSFFKVTALEPWWDGSILLVCVLDLWDIELLLLLHTQNGWKIMKGGKLFVPRVGFSSLPCLSVGHKAFDPLVCIFQCS